MNITKEGLFVYNQIENHFKKNLVHMLYIDELPSLLEESTIKKDYYVSFTRHFPMNFSHGNVAIVFKRSKLRKKYKLSDIEYTAEYMNKHPDIKHHVFQGMSDEEIFEKGLLGLKMWIDKFKSLPQTPDIKNRISQIQILIREMKKDFMKVSLMLLANENETLIRKGVFEFNVDDIFCIIYPTRSFLKYYPISETHCEKLFFIEDYFPIECEEESSLSLWLNYIGHIFEEFEKESSNNNLGLPFLYHYVYGIAMGMKQFCVPDTPKENIKISDDVDFILKSLPLIKNKDSKYMIGQYLTHMQFFGEDSDNNFVIEQSVEQLRKIKGYEP